LQWVAKSLRDVGKERVLAKGITMEERFAGL
jgi:hypothetical protein